MIAVSVQRCAVLWFWWPFTRSQLTAARRRTYCRAELDQLIAKEDGEQKAAGRQPRDVAAMVRDGKLKQKKDGKRQPSRQESKMSFGGGKPGAAAPNRSATIKE